MSTVLVVEDSVTQREMITDLLKGSGLTVTVASDGVEALERIQAHCPDLVVLDIVMPRMNGRQLAEQVAKISPGIRTLYISGYTDNAIVHYGVLDSGLWFLPKPFTLSALVAKVREVLDSVTDSAPSSRGD